MDLHKKMPTKEKMKSSYRKNSAVISSEDIEDEDGQSDLIEKLNALRDSCEKFTKKGANPYETPKRQMLSTRVLKDDKMDRSKARRSLMNSPCSASKNVQRKKNSASKRKRSLSPAQNNFVEEDEEGSLVIVEPKNRKKPKSAALDVNDVPAELMEIISKSGIDDILEEKAQKTQLTAIHVKKIIRDVITDEGVLSMVRNLLGVEEHPLSFQPRLTRAKTKELIYQQMMENGDLSASPIPPMFMHPDVSISAIPGVSLHVSETQSLVTEDFPEEEEDEEYRPEADEQALSDDERGTSNCSTPCSVATPRSSVTTPRSVGTPSSSYEFTRFLDEMPTVAQRTLDFANPKSLICSRTRSKFSMTDTPLEELESAFKPPDITPDMYETECYDDVWKEFLMDFAQPQGKNDAAAEDDYVVDPEYNLMADAEKEVKENINDLKEELRVDRAVRVTKREYNDLMSELLDSFTCASDDEVEVEAQREEHNLSLNYSQNSIEDRVYTVPNSAMENQQCISTCQQQVTEPIKVKILIPEFPSQFLEILKNQWLQHVQLLTSVAVLCNHRPYFESVANECRKMLNEMEEASPRQDSLYHPWNLQPAFDTLKAHDRKKLDDHLVMRATINPLSFVHFPTDVKEVFLHSSALPFNQLLPKGLFSRDPHPKPRKFMPSEDLLLALRLQDVFSEECNRQVVLNSNRGLYDTIVDQINKVKNIYYQKRSIGAHMLNLRKNKLSTNPVSILFSNLHRRDLTVEVPPLTVMEMLPGMPCQLKDVPANEMIYPWKAIVRDFWIQQPIAKQYVDTNLKMRNIIIIQSSTAGTQIIIPPVERPPVSAETESGFFQPIIPQTANHPNAAPSAAVTQVQQPASNNSLNSVQGNIVFQYELVSLPPDPCVASTDVTDTPALHKSPVNGFVKPKGCAKKRKKSASSKDASKKKNRGRKCSREEIVIDPSLLSTSVEEDLVQDPLLLPSNRKEITEESTEEDPLLLSEISPGDVIPDEYLNPVTPFNQSSVDMPFFMNTPVRVSRSEESSYSVRPRPDAKMKEELSTSEKASGGYLQVAVKPKENISAKLEEPISDIPDVSKISLIDLPESTLNRISSGPVAISTVTDTTQSLAINTSSNFSFLSKTPAKQLRCASPTVNASCSTLNTPAYSPKYSRSVTPEVTNSASKSFSHFYSSTSLMTPIVNRYCPTSPLQPDYNSSSYSSSLVTPIVNKEAGVLDHYTPMKSPEAPRIAPNGREIVESHFPTQLDDIDVVDDDVYSEVEGAPTLLISNSKKTRDGVSLNDSLFTESSLHIDAIHPSSSIRNEQSKEIKSQVDLRQNTKRSYKDKRIKPSFSESPEEPDKTTGSSMKLREIRHSPKKSPVKKVDSRLKKVHSPVKKVDSHVRKVDSPVKKVDSPVKKVDSPRKRLQNYLKKPARTKKSRLLPKVYSKSNKKRDKANAKKISKTSQPSSLPETAPGQIWTRDDDLIFVNKLNEEAPSELVKDLATFFPNRTEEQILQRLKTIASFIIEKFS